MPLSEFDHRDAITPLRLVFWGMIICIVDLPFRVDSGGVGCTFDIINDVVGTVMVLVGVVRLGGQPVDGAYRSMLGYVQFAVALCVLVAIHSHFVYEVPIPVTLAEGLISLLGLIAIFVFASAMIAFCDEGEFAEAATSWRLTRLLVICIYLVPAGLAIVIGAVVLAVSGEVRHFQYNTSGGSVEWGAACFGILLLVVLAFVPFIHGLVSIFRTIKALRDAPPGPDLPPTPDVPGRPDPRPVIYPPDGGDAQGDRWTDER